jgi:replication factor C subunit 2/4
MINPINNNKKPVPWVDKYRPAKLSDVVHQDEVIAMLNNTLKTGVLPHTLFYGPPGTGKTSVILAIAMQLFGPKKYEERVIELNASDERGINVVRNKIVSFAKSLIGSPDPNYPSPPYKIIILDEADAMTTEAQSALRKVIEDYSSITRFCFICNYINQIIQPIISRCVKFRFKPLNKTSMLQKLGYIIKRERMNLDQDVIDKIIDISLGDLRKAIMLLQNICYIEKHSKITVNDIIEISGNIPPVIIDKINNVCILNKSSKCADIAELAKNINLDGYSMSHILWTINTFIINNTLLSDISKSKICLHVAKTEKRLVDGADEYLQLLSILTCIKMLSHDENLIY